MADLRACRVATLCLSGADAVPVEIELQLTGGLMQRIILTGLPGEALRESRDRIRGCLASCGLPMPRRSVLANFAPADVPKDGNGFDLPLAVGILALQGVVEAATLDGRVLVGEIALDGRLRPVRGALTLALAARRRGCRRLLLPAENGPQARLVDGLVVEAVGSLGEALAVLGGAEAPAPAPAEPEPVTRLDLEDVRGQPSARRALEIAAAGRHNLLLHGPPGTGKTMLAQRLPSILPPLDEATSLEVTALHGLAGVTSSVVRHPPLRAPHHSMSRMSLVGGGRPIRPGEVSLAHAGVLFLDELPEFPRTLLESLRQPLEDRCVRIARVGDSVRFPADVQLVAAMNPCPCGFLGHPTRGCGCSQHAVDAYRQRISGPLWDRIDLIVEVPVQPAEEMLSRAPSEPSAVVARRVATARAQTRRPPALPGAGPLRTRLAQAIDGFGLSARRARRLLDVALTIALLDGREAPAPGDLDEALSFQRLPRAPGQAP